MAKRKISYHYIESFQELEEEKTRLLYEVRLARRKLDLSVMEFSAALSPMRLLSSALAEWIKPLSGALRQWIESKITGQSRK
ncbi:hypothetical protein [Alkalitalea saponilacus]|uniref:Uncharacterized protein n=1 Tax=Alkalitalea saponilacus TaxID=889453 RepID=A0A1T5DFI9_9BACT|nr:hypothetical protein [Alkalitalea saponilacus]ASB50683.1 hypothetical protein CDL62_16760 [Alkalitalea saponilacus]SKB70293.1 hypothetical protein SAMN03080601_01091 [Alkalitalea saponilacus]